MTNDELIAALGEYDAAMTHVKAARSRLQAAERELRRAAGAKPDTYMDGNELVAALGRKIVENLVADR